MTTAGTYRIERDGEGRERFDALMDGAGEGYTFTSERVEAFADATGDDHPLHVADRTYMERFNEVYDGLLDDPLEAEGDGMYRNVVHGVYTLTASLSLLDTDPSHLSARFDRPVFHAPEPDRADAVTPVAEDTPGVHPGLHRYTMMRDDGPVATFSCSDAETEAADGMYALCRGMGAFDREGDVLLSFSLITFPGMDLDGVEELVLDRTLHAERAHPAGDIRTYRNHVATIEGERVATYRETDLELAGYADVFGRGGALRSLSSPD